MTTDKKLILYGINKLNYLDESLHFLPLIKLTEIRYNDLNYNHVTSIPDLDRHALIAVIEHKANDSYYSDLSFVLFSEV